MTSKHRTVGRFARVQCALTACFPLLLLSGCSTPEQTAGAIAGGIVATTVVGARAPGHEIEQIYYLGVFDPQEQVPPTIYRLTVHGQASSISGVKFASGWVPAIVVDSLAGNLRMDANAHGSGLTIERESNPDNLAEIKTGRRLIQFGPEGFREAPKNHRLVIVMGSSPKKFFQAVDEALGQISGLQSETANLGLRKTLFEAFVSAQKDEERLADLEGQIRTSFGE